MLLPVPQPHSNRAAASAQPSTTAELHWVRRCGPRTKPPSRPTNASHAAKGTAPVRADEGAAVATLITVLAGDPPGITAAGENAQVERGGTPVTHEKLTALLNAPFCGLTFNVNCAVCPG